MRISTPAGIRLTKSFEQCRLVVYLDEAGYPTAGWGHRVLPEDNLKVGDTVTQAWADAKFLQDYVAPQQAVEHYAGQQLTDAQFSALVDFAYNEGVGNFYEFAELHMRQGVMDQDALVLAVPPALLKWINAGGRPLEDLMKRRVAEAAMFCGLTVSLEMRN